MEESGDDDSYGSFFDIDINQYPNLSANFSYEAPGPGFYLNQDLDQGQLQHQQQHQMEQDQEPVTSFRPGQLLQMPLQPQPQQFSAVNVNLLSLQPLPQGKRLGS